MHRFGSLATLSAPAIASAQNISLGQFVEFLIALGVISPDKVAAARAFVASNQTTNTTTNTSTSDLSIHLTSSPVASDRTYPAGTQLMDYRVTFDGTRYDPAYITLQLSCPAGVTAVLSGTTSSFPCNLYTLQMNRLDDSTFDASFKFANNNSYNVTVGAVATAYGTGPITTDKDAFTLRAMNSNQTTTNIPTITVNTNVFSIVVNSSAIITSTASGGNFTQHGIERCLSTNPCMSGNTAAYGWQNIGANNPLSYGTDNLSVPVTFSTAGTYYIHAYMSTNGGASYAYTDSVTLTVTNTTQVIQPSITVTSPNGGETLVQGQNTLIKWQGGSYPVQIGVVHADFPSDKSVVGWIQLRGNANDQIYWDTNRIGDLTVGGQWWFITPGQYKIIVVSPNSIGKQCFGSSDCVYSVSNSPFTITSPTPVTTSQSSVSSSNTTIQQGQAFTPSYSGGSGSGSWQFVIVNYTNWNPGTGHPAGTDLGNNPSTDPASSYSASWTPSSDGSYQFYVAKNGDSSYLTSNYAGPYTLTVTSTTISPPNPPLTQKCDLAGDVINSTNSSGAIAMTVSPHTLDLGSSNHVVISSEITGTGATHHGLERMTSGGSWENADAWTASPCVVQTTNSIWPKTYFSSAGTYYFRAYASWNGGASYIYTDPVRVDVVSSTSFNSGGSNLGNAFIGFDDVIKLLQILQK